MAKLTERFVSSIEPHPGKETFYWDDQLKGFGVRVSSSGRKTYFVQYRNANQSTRRYKIGIHGTTKAERARSAAKKLLGSIEAGADPARDRQAIKEAATVSDLAKSYLEHHAPKKRESSLRNDRSMLQRFILPRLGKKMVTDIKRWDITKLHNAMKDTPYQANRTLALLSKMFSLSVQWEWRPDNPVKGVERFTEEPRDRWLSREELGRLLDALAAHPNQLVADAVRLLILTGARRSEVFSATWDQFDLANGTWTKSSHHTKQKRAHRIPISAPALEILHRRAALRDQSGFVFPGKKEDKPLQDIKRFWKNVLKSAQIEKLRIHDLRHTYASHLVSSGHSLLLVGRLLGHTQPQTTYRYAHLADDPLREATDRFADAYLNSEQVSNDKNVTVLRN